MLVYALDRTQATPLTTFTPIDILRNTLGVGPCQYILQTEGLASDANPTPDNVMTWIEKQFSRKKEKKAAGEIRERLAQMVEHVGQADARIVQLPPHVRRGESALRRGCRRADTGRRCHELLKRISIRRGAGVFDIAACAQDRASSRARQLADEVIGLIGTDNAAPGCEKLGGESPCPRRRAGSHVGRLPDEGPLVETVGRHAGGRSSRRRRIGRKGPIQG